MSDTEEGVIATPIVVNTASATPVRIGAFRIIKIRWVGGSAAGHRISITDTDGHVKFATVATGANYVESETWDIARPLVSDGIVVPTMDSGSAYIYVEP